jgi:hypothetical protein
VRDSRSLEAYGGHILGARKAIPRLLDLFERHCTQATWATVGLLFFDEKDELLAHVPEVQPAYRDSRLSPYPDLGTIGRNEREDPYHYGLSLIRKIMSCPGQEIGTHTFAHYFCLEPGQDGAAFRANLESARRASERLGITLQSIVFPRNQVRADYLGICRESGLIAYRGNEDSWMYAQGSGAENRMLKRGARLIDSHINISGIHGASPAVANGLANIPSSRFLRPVNTGPRLFDALRLKRVLASMDHAARNGQVFHLWWHPHNFGRDTEACSRRFSYTIKNSPKRAA